MEQQRCFDVILECRDRETAALMYNHFKGLEGKGIMGAYSRRIDVYETVKSGRFLLVNVVGVGAEAYWTFFQYAEENLHQVALIGVILAEGAADLPTLAESQGATDWVRRKILFKFLETIDLSNYDGEWRRRIATMCTFGDDTEEAVIGISIVLDSDEARNGEFPAGRRMWYADGIDKCISRGEDGPYNLVRVMLHLLCLEQSRLGYGLTATVHKKVTGIKKMFLG